MSDEKKISVVLLGAAAVGKSMLTLRYMRDKFKEGYEPTIEDKYPKNVTINNSSYLVEIIDTAGDQGFINYLENWIAQGNAFLLCFSLTDEDSFKEKVVGYYNRIAANVGTKLKYLPITLVGTKCDLENERIITHEEAKDLANEWGVKYFETSAKESINVKETFQQAIEAYINKKEKPAAPKRRKTFWQKLCRIL